MVPSDLLEVVGIVDAHIGQVVVRHVFGGAAGAYGARIFEHRLVGCREGGGNI